MFYVLFVFRSGATFTASFMDLKEARLFYIGQLPDPNIAWAQLGVSMSGPVFYEGIDPTVAQQDAAKEGVRQS